MMMTMLPLHAPLLFLLLSGTMGQSVGQNMDAFNIRRGYNERKHDGAQSDDSGSKQGFHREVGLGGWGSKIMTLVGQINA